MTYLCYRRLVAVEHAKLVSREVCGHHNDDGVARWIEEHLL